MIFCNFLQWGFKNVFGHTRITRCKTIAPVNCRCTVFRLGGFPHPQTWMEWGGLLPAASPIRLAMKEAVFPPAPWNRGLLVDQDKPATSKSLCLVSIEVRKNSRWVTAETAQNPQLYQIKVTPDWWHLCLFHLIYIDLPYVTFMHALFHIDIVSKKLQCQWWNMIGAIRINSGDPWITLDVRWFIDLFWHIWNKPCQHPEQEGSKGKEQPRQKSQPTGKHMR